MKSPIETFQNVILDHAERVEADCILVDLPLAEDPPVIRFRVAEEWSELPTPPAELVSALFQSLLDILLDPNLTDQLADTPWRIRRSAESQIVLARDS